jgi:hypothetical protein
MHVQIAIEQTWNNCSRCGTNPSLRVNLFTKEAIAEGKHICVECIAKADGVIETLELAEPAVEVGKRKSLKRQKKASREQEIDIAEELGAKVQINSGATVGSKGDVRKKDVVRIEAKFTTAASYSLKLEELHKIAGECEGKEKPVFVVDFQDPLTHRPRDRYAIIPFEDYRELFDASHIHR